MSTHVCCALDERGSGEVHSLRRIGARLSVMDMGEHGGQRVGAGDEDEAEPH